MQDDLPALPPAQIGLYRHYKGGQYEVLGVVRHSETCEPLVLYRALYGSQGLWVRPHAMFFEQVTVQGQQVPRFAPVAGSASGPSPSAAPATPAVGG